MIDSNNINVMREKLRKIGGGNGSVQEEIERIDNLIGASPIPGSQRTITSSLNYLYDRVSTDYSTDEINTHIKWIDNKDIYVKVIERDTQFIGVTNSYVDYADFDGNIGELIDTRFMGYDDNDDSRYNLVGQIVKIGNGKISIAATSNYGYDHSKLILYYTKNE